MLGRGEGFRPTLDIDHAQRRADALRVCAATPTLIMALYRQRQGLEPIEPREDLGYGANYLWMLRGEEADPDLGRAVEQYQMTTIDHGFNASTFTARVITSTGADVGARGRRRHRRAVRSACTAARRHARSTCSMRSARLSNARPYLIDAVNRGERIMGFGHAVSTGPRTRGRPSCATSPSASTPRSSPFARAVEQTVVEVLAELKPGRDLYANVEFYAGVVMDHCGLPRELFTPTFASSRVIGWCANILEQAADNRIIRPSARYVGPPPPQPVPDIS